MEGRWLGAAVVVGVAICCFAGLAISAALQPEGPLGIFNPDRERLAAAAFSGGVLAAASLVFTLVGRRPQQRRCLPMATLLGFMALDEVLGLHERLERFARVDWRLLYAPLIAVAALAWWRLLRSWGLRRKQGLLLLVGSLCWGVSQVLEAAQWDGGVRHTHYLILMVTEEILEVTGSAAFLLAGLAVLLSAAAAHPERAPSAIPVTLGKRSSVS